MITITPDKLTKGETIQKSLEYLDQSLDFVMDKSIEQDYKLKIIFSSGKRLSEEYSQLLKESTIKCRGVILVDDWAACRLLVLRLLVKATPCPAQLNIHPENKIIFHYLYNLRFLRELFSQMNPLNRPHLLPKDFILETLLEVESRGFNLDCLSMNGYPLLLCSLPYQGDKSGYYLPSFHTVTLFANSYPKNIKQFVIIHELGHALYHLNNLKQQGQKLPGEEFEKLLKLLKLKYPPSRVTTLKTLKERHIEEAFANLLASYLLGHRKKDNQEKEVEKLLIVYLKSLMKSSAR